jgi:hypothetical protein
MLRLIILTAFLSLFLYGYEDLDVDGVDDSVDKCLNTSFDDEVGEDGCPYDKSYRGKLTIGFGKKIAYSKTDLQTNSFNFYANYRYNNWSLSFSTSSYDIFDNLYSDLNLWGDYYLTGGYSYTYDKFTTQYSLGVKIPNNDSDISSKEFDFFAFINLNYRLSDAQNIYGSYGYTLRSDSDTQNYKNYNSLMVGSSYMMSDRWQVNFNYNYSGSTYENKDDYHTISFGNYYEVSDKVFVKMRYDRGLDDNSYKNAFSLSIGRVFE